MNEPEYNPPGEPLSLKYCNKQTILVHLKQRLIYNKANALRSL